MIIYKNGGGGLSISIIWKKPLDKSVEEALYIGGQVLLVAYLVIIYKGWWWSIYLSLLEVALG